MATVNKDFKIKYGLIVEGANATVNGNEILTENAGDQYILDLIGGETLVKSVSNEFDVSGAGELSIDRATVDAYYDAAGSATTAANAVAGDLTDHENATVAHGATGAVVGTTNTQTLTNKTIGDTLNFTGAGAMTINSDSHIVLTPAAGSSVKWGANILATQGYADQAEADAISTASADATSKANAAQAAAEATASSDATSKANAALASANTYTDGAVSALVDSAPELLNTLNELAEALGDSPDTITNLATLVGTKADTSYVDAEISDLDTAAQGYASAAQAAAETTASADATSKANAAQSAAETYADGLAVNYAPAGSVTTAINALDTDAIEEGEGNLYFTDARAKTSAADLLTGASLTNITITGTGAGLTITAENGVADSDTDDLVEGSTNKYFTDVRAVDALEAVVPDFTAVEINSLAKQVASTVSVATASQVTAYEFLGTEYRSAKFLVKTAQGSHTDIAEVLLTMDSSNNISITQYAMVGTNGSLMTITADYVEVGTTVRLRVTTANNTSVVTVVGTLLA
jgi:hypothetical protein